jgi:hypothetical protein
MIQTFDSPLVVENPAEILRNEEGVFEVVSPYGHVFAVICRRGSQMKVREISQSEPAIDAMPQRSGWHIKRIAGNTATAA